MKLVNGIPKDRNETNGREGSMENFIQLIEDFNSHYTHELVQLKYELMKENHFRFFRETRHIFFHNLSQITNQINAPGGWICGDLHLENLGSYKGENRMVYFDLNDFDQVALALLSFELARIVNSIFIAFESLNIDGSEATVMVSTFLNSYSHTFKEGKPYDIDVRIAKGIIGDFLRAVEKRKYKKLLPRKMGRSEKISSIVSHPKHSRISADTKREVITVITKWINTRGDSFDNYKVMMLCFG